MDELTKIAGAGGIWASKDIVNKLLGPTADYLGGEVRDFVEKQHDNLKRIFDWAVQVLGIRINHPGGVNSRVLRSVIDEGRFCEDEVAQRYLGGVLASSRSEGARDDRGASYLAIVTAMSSYELRLHYILYGLVRRLYAGTGLNVQEAQVASEMAVWMSLNDLNDVMFPAPRANREAILIHVLTFLFRRGLVGQLSAAGTLGHHRSRFPRIPPGPGVLLTPTDLGTALYLWAFGYPDTPPAKFLNDEIVLQDTLDIPLPKSALALHPDVGTDKDKRGR